MLVVCDDDSDPYNAVREWWNSDGHHYATPREHLFEQLGVASLQPGSKTNVGKGGVLWMRENPVSIARSADGDTHLLEQVKAAKPSDLSWRETNYLLLRRGPYVVAAGLDESIAGEPRVLRGRFVNLYDAELRVQDAITLTPGHRFFLLDLDRAKSGPPAVLASACKVVSLKQDANSISLATHGVGKTPAIVLLRAPKAPSSVTLAGEALTTFEYANGLLWVHFQNEATPRRLTIVF